MTAPDVAAIADGLNVGVTGTRKGLTDLQAKAAENLLIAFRGGGLLWLGHGDCVGADKQLALFWKAMGGKLRSHPPTNPSLRAYIESDEVEQPKHYLNRNRDIVNAAGVMIATPAEMVEQNRGGTWSTVRYARMRDKPLWIVLPDGSIVSERAHILRSERDA